MSYYNDGNGNSKNGNDNGKSKSKNNNGYDYQLDYASENDPGVRSRSHDVDYGRNYEGVGRGAAGASVGGVPSGGAVSGSNPAVSGVDPSVSFSAALAEAPAIPPKITNPSTTYNANEPLNTDYNASTNYNTNYNTKYNDFTQNAEKYLSEYNPTLYGEYSEKGIPSKYGVDEYGNKSRVDKYGGAPSKYEDVSYDNKYATVYTGIAPSSVIDNDYSAPSTTYNDYTSDFDEIDPDYNPNSNPNNYSNPDVSNVYKPSNTYGNNYSQNEFDTNYNNNYSGFSPTNIFNSSIPPPNFKPLNNFELMNLDYDNDNNNQNNNYNYNQTFVPNIYDNNDLDELEFDKNIQFDQFKGDNYDLQQVELPSLFEKEKNDEAPSIFTDTPTAPPPSVYTDNPPESPFQDQFLDQEEDNPEPVRSSEPQYGVATGLNGHLVLDCPVASELLSKFPDYNNNEKDGNLSREFGYMRYTAVTCGPSNFYRDGYYLRPIHYTHPRETELMIVITMYNEDDILLGRTLKGVFKNIKYLESRNRSNTWGKDSWKKIVVCIVSDGRSKINQRSQALLAALGVYQDGLAKSKVDDKKVQAHMYEYTTRVGINSVEDTVTLTTEKIVPVQLLFCLKENNAKKINSHRWCFQAIGKVLNPRIVVLLDCGTEPSGDSLYHLWREFDKDAQVAGACGEIKASLKKRQVLTNPLVYAQNFEYKISNILDKPTESIFGFISVLPGAFSAYRFIALQNDINGRGPLEKYYKGEFLHGSDELDPKDDEFEMKTLLLSEESGIFTSNMYLAEDRILCFELVAKKDCSWLLRYVKSAHAETDVPEGLAEFILQRRRWLNGSFFAAIYALAHFPKLWGSSHSIARQFFLHVEFIYQLLNLIISWFSLSSYFLVFRILTTSLANPDLNFPPGKVLSAVFLWLYLASLVTTFVLSFGNKPKGTERFYLVIVIFFAILMAYMIFAAIFMAIHSIKAIYDSNTVITIQLFFNNTEFRDLVVATCSTYALYFIASFMYFEPFHMFTSFVQYILLSPSYVNVLNIYAFCNIDDVSWGTKGDTGARDLGVIKVREDGKFSVIAISEAEINQSYLNQLEKIKTPTPPAEKKGPHSNEDYYAYVRSMTVLVWMFTNFVIIAVVLETGGVADLLTSGLLDINRDLRAKIFLTVILWLVAFMALFRFIGCTLYLFQRIGSWFKRSDRQKVARI